MLASTYDALSLPQGFLLMLSFPFKYGFPSEGTQLCPVPTPHSDAQKVLE